MKKVLLATSALAMMAGAASAEIALSGSARMGLIYADDGTDSSTAFSSRVRIVFTASGETDSGLSFGASMRADQFGGNDNDGSNGSSGNTGDTNGDSTVFISGSFGKLTMGEVILSRKSKRPIMKPSGMPISAAMPKPMPTRCSE